MKKGTRKMSDAKLSKLFPPKGSAQDPMAHAMREAFERPYDTEEIAEKYGVPRADLEANMSTNYGRSWRTK